MSRAQILIRCDGSPSLGMGHVMRCIALAQALQNSGRTVAFACRSSPGNGINLIRQRGFPAYALAANNMAQDAKATLDLTVALGATAVLVDLSHADTLTCCVSFIDFLGVLSAAALHVALIEGMDEECLSLRTVLPVASVIVPYLGADKHDYKLASFGRLFAGETYFPLRTEFHRLVRRSKSIPEQATRILVAIGGGDVTRLNRQVIEALAQLEHKAFTVRVLGAVECVETLPMSVEVIAYSQEMPELIDWADCAIIGSGLTRYETAYAGTPAVVFSLNRQHARMVEDFAATGAVLAGGIFSEISQLKMKDVIRSILYDETHRSRMAAAGPVLIDGKGAARLAISAFGNAPP